MDFFDEIRGIFSERKFPAGDWFCLAIVFGSFAAYTVRSSIRMGRCHLSVPCAVRAGRDDGARVHCSGGSASVVRRSLTPLHRDPAPLRGGQSMTADPFAATHTARVVFSGMSVGFALIFRTFHSRSSDGLRKALPRPQNQAVRGNTREPTDDGEVGAIRGRICPQVASRPRCHDRLGEGLVINRCHLRVLISLPEYRTPQVAFSIDHKSSSTESELQCPLAELHSAGD